MWSVMLLCTIAITNKERTRKYVYTRHNSTIAIHATILLLLYYYGLIVLSDLSVNSSLSRWGRGTTTFQNCAPFLPGVYHERSDDKILWLHTEF